MKIRGTTITTPLARHAVTDDTTVSKKSWSSKNTVDKLCPSFTESGSVAVCDPLEGYPLEVISTLDVPENGTYESITLTQRGKNIFNGGSYTYKGSYTGKATWENGNLHVYGYLASAELPAQKNTTYAIRYRSTRTGEKGGGVYVTRITASGTTSQALSQADTLDGAFTFKTTDTTEKIRISFYGGGGINATTEADYWDIQLEIADAPTDYEPYRGQTFTADFTNAPEMEDKGFYNWNTGLMNNGASSYLHNPDTGNFTMIDDEEASAIIRSIPALPGTNYIYSDCGNTEVKGKADPVKIIEKLTNAILAQGGTV